MPVSPTLFAALQRIAEGSVRIKDEGVDFVGGQLGGRPKQFGEQYELNCRFCGDTRRRMVVSAVYRPHVYDHAWYCFNERCQSNSQYRTDLSNLVADSMAEIARSGETLMPATAVSGAASTVAAVSPELPTGTVSLRSLPSTHPAHQYLLHRGFDPQDLADRYGIGFTDGSGGPSPSFGDPRIVIPGYSMDGRLVGWQARALTDAVRKYLNMTGWRKSHSVFIAPGGLPAGESMIVVEGVFDAIRVGACGAAIFGKKASRQQLDILVRLAAGRPLIIITLDRDAADEGRELATTLRQALPADAATEIIVAPPPAGRKDLGECTPEEVTSWRFAIERGTCATAVAENTSARTSPSRIRDHRGEAGHRLLEHAGIQGSWPAEELERQIQAAGLGHVWSTIEVPLLPVIARIESTGVPINEEVLCSTARSGVQLSKTASRLLRAPRLESGRVALAVNQLGCITGRLTTSQFNFENLDKPLRSAVVAPPGRNLVYIDYRSYEPRILASLCQDPWLCALIHSAEPYREWAAYLHSKPIELVSEDEHSYAKSHFMRAMYNPSCDGGLRFCCQAFAAWESDRERLATQHGWVASYFWRRISCSLSVKEKVPVVNWIVQSTGADLFKHTLIRIDQTLPATAGVLIPMHDGVLIECDETDTSAVINTLSQCAFTFLGVNFPVAVKAGHDWAECAS